MNVGLSLYLDFFLKTLEKTKKIHVTPTLVLNPRYHHETKAATLSFLSVDGQTHLGSVTMELSPLYVAPTCTILLHVTLHISGNQFNLGT